MAKEKEIKKDTEKKEVEKKETKKFNIKKLVKRIAKKIATATKKLLDKTKDYVRFHKNQVVRSVTSIGILLAVVIIAVLAVNIIQGASVGNIGYPIIYQKANNDMFLLEHGAKVEDKEQVKKMNGTGYIEYANTSNRYVLFKNDQNLYMYDVKSKETTKIGDNVNVYGFSDKDSYVYMLDADNDLYSYNYKDSKQILDNTIDSIQDYNDDGMLYSKKGNLMYVSYDPAKEDRVKIVDEYSIAEMSNDNKYVLYTNVNNTLYLYNIKKKTNEKISSDVDRFYCGEKSCKKFYYAKNEETYNLYYYDGSKSKLIVKELYNIVDINVDDQKLIYTTSPNGLDFILNFQKGTSKSSEITSNYNFGGSAILFENEVYFVDGDKTLNYAKISGSKIGKVKSVSKEVQGTLKEYAEGVYFYKKIDDDNDATFYTAKSGKATKIAEEIRINKIVLSNDKKNFYYLKDIDGKTGTLAMFDGKKAHNIAEKVYSFVYVKDDAVYYIGDYDIEVQTGNLYRYNGASDKIEDGVRYTITSTPNADNNN